MWLQHPYHSAAAAAAATQPCDPRPTDSGSNSMKASRPATSGAVGQLRSAAPRPLRSHWEEQQYHFFERASKQIIIFRERGSGGSGRESAAGSGASRRGRLILF